MLPVVPGKYLGQERGAAATAGDIALVVTVRAPVKLLAFTRR